MKESRNPPWTRDELLVALDFYLDNSHDYFSPTGEGLIALTEKISRVAKALGLTGSGSLRNANGVSMKLLNFRAHDPNHPTKGLSRGNKLEKVVWSEFSTQPEYLKRIVSSILSQTEAAIRSNPMELRSVIEEERDEAAEGRLLSRVHRIRERDPSIVKRKKASHLKRHGELSCEACNFNFSRRYGIRGEGFIECHHTKPVSDLKEGETTKPHDLILLCSNCHRMVHRKRPWLSIDELKRILHSRTPYGPH